MLEAGNCTSKKDVVPGAPNLFGCSNQAMPSAPVSSQSHTDA